jgi:hypothetical protein
MLKWIKVIVDQVKARFDRRTARRILCRRMHLKRETPDIVLRYLAEHSGNDDNKRLATFLD